MVFNDLDFAISLPVVIALYSIFQSRQGVQEDTARCSGLSKFNRIQKSYA